MTLDEYRETVLDTAEEIYVLAAHSGKFDGLDVGLLAQAFAHVGATILNVHEQDAGGSPVLTSVRLYCAAMFAEEELRH